MKICTDCGKRITGRGFRCKKCRNLSNEYAIKPNKYFLRGLEQGFNAAREVYTTAPDYKVKWDWRYETLQDYLNSLQEAKS
jgi:hypothetical protein